MSKRPSSALSNTPIFTKAKPDSITYLNAIGNVTVNNSSVAEYLLENQTQENESLVMPDFSYYEQFELKRVFFPKLKASHKTLE